MNGMRKNPLLRHLSAGCAATLLLVSAALAQPGSPEGPGGPPPPPGGDLMQPDGGPGGPGGPGGFFGPDRREQMRDRFGIEMGSKMIPRLLDNPEAQEKLGLSDAQVSQIKAIELAAEKQEVDLEAQTRKARIDLREAMQADDTERDKVMSLLEDVGKAELALKKLQTGKMLDVKAVLTPEQREKARNLRKEMGRRFMHQGGPKGGPEGKEGGGRPFRRGLGRAQQHPGAPGATPMQAPEGDSLDRMIEDTPAAPGRAS